MVTIIWKWKATTLSLGLQTRLLGLATNLCRLMIRYLRLATNLTNGHIVIMHSMSR